MSSLIQQRRAMYEQKMQDDYPGCDFGCFISRTINLIPTCVLPEVSIPSNCTSVLIYHHLGIASGFPFLILYKDGAATSNNNTYGADSFTKTMTAGQFDALRVVINLDHIDDCYIYDNTNGAYLWKGKNIV